MIKWLIKNFIKDHQNIENHSVRESYGVFSGVLGILCNVFLFAIKLTIGFMTQSIAITSDAFNNLMDTGSSIVAIIGAKVSNRDADQEHPFGHGRFEYIASLIISFIIAMVGFELFKSAIDKIINPVAVNTNVILSSILVGSVLIKLWMYAYNKYIGNLIDSPVNKATASDSLNDVLATSAVIVSTLLDPFVNIPLDGIAGLIVSSLIMFTGYSIAKDTVKILLGMSPSEELVERIMVIVTSNPLIKGAHDLKVHDYGPGRSIASIHTELSDQTNIVKAHAIIDGLEKQVMRELGIDLVIHVDPIGENQVGPID